MKKASSALSQLLNGVLAFALAAMSILVFVNVILRYAFNSGITWSEEMARFLFIWMTFLGAIAGLKDNDHLGVDMLIKKLPYKLKKVVFVISNLLVLYILWLVLDGSYKMTLLNMDSKAPATGLPMSFIYGTGIVTSIGMGMIVIYHLYRTLFKKATEEELSMTKESEELLDTTIKR